MAAADELHPAAREAGLGMMAMKPFCGGLVDGPRVAFEFLRQFPDVVPLPGWDTVASVNEVPALYQGENVVTPEDQAEMGRYRRNWGINSAGAANTASPAPRG